MSKKFDSAAYVAAWDAKVIPAMLFVIAVSLVLAVFLNVMTRPSCIRHEYVFCGTTEVLQGESGHGGNHASAADAAHGGEAAHGEAAAPAPH